MFTYRSIDWGGSKTYWLVLFENLRGRDLFTAEVDTTTHWNFYLSAQIGGDCLLSTSFALGKISVGITIWGY